MTSSSKSAYRSIFLSDRAPHQRYFGWRVAAEGSGWRSLQRMYGPVRRTLVLLTAGGLGALEDALRQSRALQGLSDIYVRDFDRALDASAEMAGSRFSRLPPDAGLLNPATFAVDLSRDETALLAAMTSDYRRKIKKAREAGVVIHAHEAPQSAMIADFVSQYCEFAKSRGFDTVGEETVARMYEGGDAVLFTAESQGETSNYLHVYRTEEAGLFMYGVNGRKQNDGAGQLLHWEAMRWLKARGVHWYDLGGVASTDPADGIYVFKQRFGGEFVDLGQELRRHAPLVQAAAALKRRLRG